MSDLSLRIDVTRMDGWVTVNFEDDDGTQLSSITAPVISGATFDAISSAILMAVAEGVTTYGWADR